MTEPQEKYEDLSLKVKSVVERFGDGEVIDELTLRSTLKEIQEYKNQFSGDYAIETELGAIYCLMGKKRESLRHNEVAIKYSPQLSTALMNYGLCLSIFGDFHEAKELYGKALEMLPDNTVLLVKYANTCIKVKDFPSARETTGKLDALIGNNDKGMDKEVALSLYKEIAYHERVAEIRAINHKPTPPRGTDEEYNKHIVEIADEMEPLRKEATDFYLTKIHS